MFAQHRHQQAEQSGRVQVIEGPQENWQKEAILGWFSGVCYGATNVIVGHPFDTVKTKMQASSRHMSYTARDALANVIR